MYLPKRKTKKVEEETMETKITTAENLGMELCGCLNAAVLDYGDYKLVDTPEETRLGRCECRISRIERKEEFEDAGHAMAWALTKVK